MNRQWRSFVFTFILMFISITAAAQKRYAVIDKDVVSVTTRYADGEVTTLRLGDGRIETRVRGNDGRAAGPFFSEPADRPLDALSADRYRTLKERRLIPSRRPGAADTIESVTSVTRELEAFSRRGAAAGSYEGKELPTFTSALRDRKTQELLVVMAWYAGSQELVFNARWLREAFAVSAADIPNGWPVTPNMAWANIQMLSFVRSHEDQLRREGVRPAGGGRFALIPHDDEGCTGLHWLDGGVLRPCCDDHDRCFSKMGCDYRSWWFQGSWSCVQCNTTVVVCFAARLGACQYLATCPIISYRWDYGDNVYDCFLSAPGYCPAWCRACTYY